MANGYPGSGAGSRPGGERQARGGDRRDRGETGGGNEAARLNTAPIKLKAVDGAALSPDLFDRVARETARAIAGDARNQANKPAQIRQFYDELVMWDEKTRAAPERFPEFLPFIRMLNAKAAYSLGRRHVDRNFTDLIACCLEQVDDPATLRNFKIFFEAFLGFYKQERPSG